MRRGTVTVVFALFLVGCAARTPPAPTLAPAAEAPAESSSAGPGTSDPVPAQTLPPVTLTDVALATPGTGFAVDSGSSIYKSTDGGLHWTKVFDEPTVRLQQIQFQDAQNGFAKGFFRCADICPALYTTRDGGQHWTLIEPSFPPGLHEIWGGNTIFPTPEVGYTVKQFGIEGGERYPDRQKLEQAVLATTDGGRTWESRPLPDGYRATGGISFIDSEHGLITAAGPKGYAILRTADGGRKWQVVHTTDGDPTGAPLYAVQFTSAKDAVAAGGWYRKFGLSPMQLVLATYDGGATWSEIYRGDDREAAAIVEIRFTDPQIGWARTGIATLGANRTISGRLLLTRDGGHTWQETGEKPESAMGPQRLSAVGQAVWLLVLPLYPQDDGAALLHRTQDTGATWQSVELTLPLAGK